ncbi:hypothetical protein BT69DRAFT_1284110 [Atractiella rhizophila]|nr:hypothetical protein BT69DRAFT_1284110 [Atractiella rhizophila]
MEDEIEVHNIFGGSPSPEPEAPRPTPVRYQCSNGQELTISLPSAHPLWGHVLYPASISLARYLESNPELVRNKKVIEFGAGGGLPSLIACKEGAGLVIVTDYPDAPLIKNLEENIEGNLSPEEKRRIVAKGFVWGRPPRDFPATSFDLLLLSDLVFNHSQHQALLASLDSLSHSESGVLCFFSHHRPHLVQQDLNFLKLAEEAGWDVTRVIEEKRGVAFPEDDEKWRKEKEIREVVHGWKLTRCDRNPSS